MLFPLRMLYISMLHSQEAYERQELRVLSVKLQTYVI